MQEVHPWKFGLIMRKMREIDAIYRGAAARANIPEGELAIWLVLLHLEKECSQQDICDFFSLPRQTVNSLIANLRKKGYVCLKPAPNSRNRKLICLTESGRAFGQQKVAWIFQAEHRVREAATPESCKWCFLCWRSIFRTFVRRLTRPTLRANRVRRTL